MISCTWRIGSAYSSLPSVKTTSWRVVASAGMGPPGRDVRKLRLGDRPGWPALERDLLVLSASDHGASARRWRPPPAYVERLATARGRAAAARPARGPARARARGPARRARRAARRPRPPAAVRRRGP